MRIIYIIDSYNSVKSGSYHSILNGFRNFLKNKNISSKIINPYLLKNNKEFFINSIKRADICHFFGGWSLFHIKSFLIAKKLDKKIIIHTMGFYEPWAFNHKRIKKIIAWEIYQKRILLSANFIHCASNKEKENLLKLNKNLKIKVLPFGIEKDFIKRNQYKKIPVKHKALFFSRLHPVKGIEDLINCWNKINNENWELHVIGPKENDFFYSKINILKKKNYYNNIKFFKPIFGYKKKAKLFCKYDFLVLPSKSENFGIVILESLARGLPVLTTKNTPWLSIKKFNAGWIINNDNSELTRALKNIFNLNSRQFETKSNNAINLAKKYKLEIVLKKYLKVYNDLMIKS
jgi:glycosyltransferase involved in cell wall biosynthesis